ncbi:hypothetical protein Tco_0960981 [Tanacetum coccineum]
MMMTSGCLIQKHLLPSLCKSPKIYNNNSSLSSSLSLFNHQKKSMKMVCKAISTKQQQVNPVEEEGEDGLNIADDVTQRLYDEKASPSHAARLDDLTAALLIRLFIIRAGKVAC